ncbi:MAG: hypothetical protein Q8K90_01005 [Brevundimonas sp.]|nr:hypothetical protein [Brevundimonas sp.]
MTEFIERAQPIPDNPVRATMFTVAQCLAKAVELEQRAAEPHPPDIRAEFAGMALQWRRLAARAEIHDRRVAAAIARMQQA